MFTILLQEAPANTNSYMVAGYTVIFGTMLLYLLSLAVRWKNLKEDLAVLEQLDKS